MMGKDISRRTFLSGAALGTIGLASTGLLACSPQTQGSGDAANSDDAYDFAADVVVIGSGGAGFMACVGAHESGASTLLIEKADKTGGDSRMCHQDILAFWPQRTLQDGGVEDTYESYLSDWRSSHAIASVKGLRGDPEPEELPFCERFMDVFPEVGDWLANTAGVEFEPLVMGASMAITYTFEPRSWHATSVVVQAVNDVCDTWDDFTLLLNSEATSLIKDDSGKVCGVSFTTTDGALMKARANKAVVVASGSFNGNPSMIARYIDPVFAGYTTCGSRYNAGDGHKLVQQAGGALVDMDLGLNWENAPIGTNNIWLLDNYMGNFSANEGAIALNDPAICVNLSGKRYMNESLGYNGMGRETAKQAYGIGYYLCDSTLGNEFLKGCDVVLWGDTLEELAEKMCVDPKTFVDEIARYNGFVDAGVDEDFGKSLEGTTRIEKPPFYALIIKPQHYVTLGGISTDVDSHVLDAEGNPIPGLYAAGICCGSYWEQQGVLYYGGFNQALAFGMQAGRNAAAEEGSGDTFGEVPPAAAAAAASENPSTSAAQRSYADGSYTGTGTGMGGKINVTLEISDGAISVTDISPNNETEGIGGYEAIEDGTFKSMIEAAQSADIDAVSGATVTSKAIMSATQEALNQATS